MQEMNSKGWIFRSLNLVILKFGAVFLFSFLIISPVWSDDNTILLESNVTYDAGNTLYIGETGTNNSLLVTDGGILLDRKGYIGYGTNAVDNYAVVEGAGSIWTNRGSLSVGYSGSRNQLFVRQGAKVYSNYGYVGYDGSANNNFVQLDGVGSEWNIRKNLSVGHYGSFNRLEILDGATLIDAKGYIGNKRDSDGNELFVSGSGSLWTNSSLAYVGLYGSENNLTVTNGGKVVSSAGVLGYRRASRYNETFVTGAGSEWAMTGDLRVGRAGKFNLLMVQDGGVVSNNKGYVGELKSGDENEVWVTGSGSVWTNASTLFVGYSGSENLLVATNGGSVFSKTGYLGYDAGAGQNQIKVTGLHSTLVVENDFSVGREGTKNTLIISDGGRVENRTGYVGYGTNASFNVARITGSGSVWTNRNNLVVGRYGSENRLEIEDGGEVDLRYGYVGRGASASQNGVELKGYGSEWKISENLSVGYRGSSNWVEVLDGAILSTKKGYIGNQTNAVANQLFLSGQNTVWTNSDSIYVGYDGAGNRLVVTNAAGVLTKRLALGYRSNDNWMILTDKAMVETITAYIGRNGSDNTALITGNGTIWNNYDAFFVGYGSSSTGNLVQIQDEAALLAAAVDVRSGNSLKMNNGGKLTVSGGSSASLHGGGSFVAGDHSGGNVILVENGGEIESGETIFGLLSSASGNSATVDGSGSKWTMGALHVGNASADNVLTIQNGGRVEASSISIGTLSSAANNQISVQGSGSLLHGSGGLSIGSGGAIGNLLTVFDGATVSADSANIYDHSTIHLENGYLTISTSSTFDSGSTLSGWGEVSGEVTNRGLIDVGDASHYMALVFNDSLILGSDSEIILDLAGINDYDQVSVAEGIDFDGTLTVRLAGGFSPQEGDVFDLFDWGTGVSSTFSVVSLPSLSGNLSWDASRLYTDGSIEVVPEPLAMGLILIFGGGLMVLNRSPFLNR